MVKGRNKIKIFYPKALFWQKYNEISNLSGFPFISEDMGFKKVGLGESVTA